MEESSVQRTADGKQDAARRRRPSEACAQRRRATLAGGELRPDSGPCLRSAAPPFSDLPAPEAPTGAAPPILAAMTTRARRRRAGRLWRPDLQLVEVNGARRGALPGGDARHMLLQFAAG